MTDERGTDLVELVADEIRATDHNGWPDDSPSLTRIATAVLAALEPVFIERERAAVLPILHRIAYAVEELEETGSATITERTLDSILEDYDYGELMSPEVPLTQE